MNELLAIAGSVEFDGPLIDEVAAHRPRAVTVLLDSPDGGDGWVHDTSPEGEGRRDRLARLLTAAELATGAAVVGFVGPAERADTNRYAAVLGGEPLVAA